ncbi:hypothetical protein PM10SUCC1_28520 [Propionigenium maris DSM 9537]|uniref:HTH cro/C1-type domain-containing protein n=1 Tax=Propionigenium maris DSM 9537 TaxID=1123000 RepID=A0A9W6GLK7_9FUSO|nr:XRE family transcriptional regulator [Propionigenium maris]GLI57338.1 hypothetical protein PM10SUCC1_28520 [Propionigenium maris DSM 9537]
MSFGNFLKEKRQKKGYTLRQMAYKTGFSHTYISDIEKEVAAKVETIEKIADVLELTKDEIAFLKREIEYFKTPKSVLEELNRLKKEKECKKEESNISHIVEGDYIQIPLYDSVSAGMGLEPDPMPVDFIPMPASMGKGCVAINVEGDSMETTINNGSVVLVKKDTEVGNNEIGVFLHEEEAVVKRYRCIDKKCYLVSDNKEYPAREVRKGDNFKVCGKVVWIMNKA